MLNSHSLLRCIFSHFHAFNISYFELFLIAAVCLPFLPGFTSSAPSAPASSPSSSASSASSASSPLSSASVSYLFDASPARHFLLLSSRIIFHFTLRVNSENPNISSIFSPNILFLTELKSKTSVVGPSQAEDVEL